MLKSFLNRIVQTTETELLRTKQSCTEYSLRICFDLNIVVSRLTILIPLDNESRPLHVSYRLSKRLFYRTGDCQLQKL